MEDLQRLAEWAKVRGTPVWVRLVKGAYWEIEQVIAVVPGVREAAVVAKKHPMLDEVPVVFIIPLAGVEGAPKDLHDTVMAACRNALADFKVPRRNIFLAEIPKGATGKLQRIGLAAKLGLTA